MSDYTELKRLAEAVRDSDIDWEPNQKTYDYFQALRDPGVVLALIVENDRLTGCDKAYAEVWEKARWIQSEMDALAAENKALRKALADVLDLYDTDEGCKRLPQYIAARDAMGKGETG